MRSELVAPLEQLEAGSRRAASAVLKYVEDHPQENHRELVPHLSKALLDLETRDYAAFAIALIGPPAKDAIPNLVTALKHDVENWVCSPFARALGAMGREAAGAIDDLLEVLAVVDDNLDTPVIVEALVSIGSNKPEVIAALQRVEHEGIDAETRKTAEAALKQLRGDS